MKTGQVVAVCQDGKYSRRVKGEVIASKKGSKILVRFPHPEIEGESVEFWAKLCNTVRFRKEVNVSTFTMKCYKHFAGWADIDSFCPWFTVHKWKYSERSTSLKDKKLLWKHGIYI